MPRCRSTAHIDKKRQESLWGTCLFTFNGRGERAWR